MDRAHLDPDAYRQQRPSLPHALEHSESNADGGSRDDSLREFLGVLSRRRLVVLLSIILTPIGAFAYSSLQSKLYEGSATVYATSGGATSALSDIPGTAPTEDPARTAATHVTLARLPTVAQRVIKANKLSETPKEFLDRSSVSAQSDADILNFGVNDPDPVRAERLATSYARAFSGYRNELDLQSIRSTRATISQKLAALAAAGHRDSALYTQLAQAARALDAAAAVQGSAAILVQPAVNAVQVRPRTKRNLVLGVMLGAVLGIGLAFLVDRLDTRIRSTDEAEAILGLPVLGELSQPPPLPQNAKTKVSMLDFPYGPYAESVRKLRANVEFANVEFANLDVGGVIMVSSALGGEGKSTVSADLAVALARSGRKVAVCDLDTRAPSLHTAFGLADNRQGLVEVAFGVASLREALVQVRLISPERTPAIRWGAHDTAASSPEAIARLEDKRAVDAGTTAAVQQAEAPRGSVSVLTLGRRRPPNPADFVGSSSVRQIVAELAASNEFVILDTPPLIPVSDGFTVSEYADAVLLVCGFETSRRPTLRSLRRLVSAFPIRVLGLVVTGVPATPGYGPYFVGGPPAPQPEHA